MTVTYSFQLFSFFILSFIVQVSCYLVAFKIAVVEKTCSHHDWLYLDSGADLNDSMGIVFSIGSTVSGFGHNVVP